MTEAHAFEQLAKAVTKLEADRPRFEPATLWIASEPYLYTVKYAFHDTDIDTDTDSPDTDIVARIVAGWAAGYSILTSDTRNFLARILARMSVSVSWNAAFTPHRPLQGAHSHLNSVVGPIRWGHSGPLCHALPLLSLSLWTSMRRRRAIVAACDSSDTW